MKKELIQRISQYLSVGGLFNPEAMDHDKVRDLLLDCLNFLQKEEPRNIPKGYSLVPTNPSFAMLEVGWGICGTGFDMQLSEDKIKYATAKYYQLLEISKSAKMKEKELTPKKYVVT